MPVCTHWASLLLKAPDNCAMWKVKVLHWRPASAHIAPSNTGAHYSATIISRMASHRAHLKITQQLHMMRKPFM